MSSAIETLVNREYQYGFVTDIDADTFARGLSEDTVRLISARKREPTFLLEWRLKAYRRWLTMNEPPLGERHVSADRLSGHQLLLGAQEREAAGESRRGRSGAASDVRALGISLTEQKRLSGVAVDAIFDSVSVGTTMKAELAKLGIIFCSFGEAVQEHPELVRKYLGSVVPLQRQLLRRAQRRGVQRRLVLLRPEGRAVPDGAVDLLPHQRRRHRPVRAHADRRRRGRLRELSRGLHGAEARHEPAARGGGRAGRARRRDDQVLDGAELVRRRRGRARRHLQLRDQARQGGRRALQDLVDAGRDRLGDHLEVSERDPAGRRLDGRVLLGGRGQQPPAGRHRHEDDPHRPEHEVHDRLQGHLGGSTATTATAARSRCCRKADGRAQLHAVRLDADRQPVRRAHVPVHRGRQQQRRSSSTRRRRRRSAKIRSSTASSAASTPSTRSR